MLESQIQSKFKHILGTRVDVIDYPHATEKIMHWAHIGQSRYVCASNVHVVMEAHNSFIYQRIVNSADMVTADGLPLVWSLRLFGVKDASRVHGPDLMLHLCEAAANVSMPIGLYGGQSDFLDVLRSSLAARFPKLEIVYAKAPPFTNLTPTEDEEVVREINASGARIMFVGLGSPEQERWMVEHKGRIGVVMLGVGEAFDLLSGYVKPAPNWMQKCGIEWLFRLNQSSSRLWRLYVKYIPRFVGLLLLQALHLRDFVGGKLQRAPKMSRH